MEFLQRHPSSIPSLCHAGSGHADMICNEDVVGFLAFDVVHMLVDPEEGPAGDPQREFLVQFPAQRVPRMFPEFHLPSRELPLSGQRSTVGTAGDEHPSA